MRKILSVFFVQAHHGMGNTKLALGLAIEISERIDEPPISLPKPHCLLFDCVKREPTATPKALRRN
jgi:hypothetical protein